jgi:NAD(P)-dependent dehydrogenase (short-subunit alcohol dehydrogenase family)
MTPSSKWTTADIPDQTGRTAVITGANTGLGYETASALAAKGADVVLAVRNLEKGKAAVDLITRTNPGVNVAVQELDLTSLDSIRAAADELKSRHDSIDLLINNAGVMTPPKSTTKDGFELQFGTNHLGHFALTNLLLDRVLAAPGSRVVTVSSVGHRFARNGIRFDDLQWERDYSRIRAYGQSKLANLMFTYELQRRLQGTNTIAVAAHPGGSNTELVRNSPAVLRSIADAVGPLLFQSAEMGALPTLRAATDPDVLGGQYYGPDGFAEQRGYPKVVASSAASHDTAAQRRLWTVSEELTKVVSPAHLTPTTSRPQ